MANTQDQEISQQPKSIASASSALRGVIAASTSISDVDGLEGKLIYQGYDIHDLAEESTFEEVIFLLWNGRLPNHEELEELRRSIGEQYEVPHQVFKLIRTFPKDVDPMDALKTAVSALAFYDPQAREISRAGALRMATKLTAQFPVIVAAIDRLRNDQEPVAPKPEMNIASNFLYMLKGKMPNEREARILDVCLVLHADHELNASTFTGRVVASTLADMYGAVTAAIAALSGPLHGGANTNVMKMLLEIESPDKAEEWIKEALTHKKKIMGIGHAVYRTEDPRATHLRRFLQEVSERRGDTHWYEILRKIEQVMMREKGMYPNVDFFSGSLYYMMGIPLDLFTPIFAVSRISGWTGHILEQYADNRLIRPRAEYSGPRGLMYVRPHPVIEVMQNTESFESLKDEKNSTKIILEHQQGNSSSHQLTPHYLVTTIIPYISAISDFQRIINEINGSKQSEIEIKEIKQNSPISIDLSGGAQAIQIIKDVVVPWRRKHAEKMAHLLEKEKEVEIGSKKAEILEKRAQAAKERAEAERIVAEAAQKREETERIKLENEKLRLELQRAQIQLALEVLALVSPNLAEAEKIAYVVKLLAPLGILVSSELEIVAIK